MRAHSATNRSDRHAVTEGLVTPRMTEKRREKGQGGREEGKEVVKNAEGNDCEARGGCFWDVVEG